MDFCLSYFIYRHVYSVKKYFFFNKPSFHCVPYQLEKRNANLLEKAVSNDIRFVSLWHPQVSLTMYRKFQQSFARYSYNFCLTVYLTSFPIFFFLSVIY